VKIGSKPRVGGGAQTDFTLDPDVEMVSTELGWQRTLFSLTSAAEVQCAIMKPESRPGSWKEPMKTLGRLTQHVRAHGKKEDLTCARNAGSPEMTGFTSRSSRRSLMLPSSATPIAKKSAA
jgi:hypothetical protein